jgi:hypothetical protein
MVQDSRRGYSFPVQFSNPLGGKSRQYHGAGLRLGSIAGEELTPVVVARNVGEQTSVLSGRVPYTTRGGAARAITLPPTELRPGEIKLVNLDQVIKKVRRGGASQRPGWSLSTRPRPAA